MKTLLLFIKSITILVLVLFFSSFSVAQKKLDVVTLKNGNVLKGKIIKQVPGQFLELETRDKNFWKFDMEDISDIRFESKQLPKAISDTVPQSNKGMFYEIRMGVLAGNSDNEKEAPFSVLVSGNYLLKSGISVGAGVGYEAFDEAQMPVFGEIKYHATVKKIRSFVFCQSGYSFSLENRKSRYYYYGTDDKYDSEGGFLINPGIGFILGNQSNSDFTLNIGYRFQKIKHKWYNSYTDDTEYLREEFNRLSIHIGILF